MRITELPIYWLILQVPALKMMPAGCPNEHHGLHLLTAESMQTIKCPWPLDFFQANNRTAFSINMPKSSFPIRPRHRPYFLPKEVLTATKVEGPFVEYTIK